MALRSITTVALVGALGLTSACGSNDDDSAGASATASGSTGSTGSAGSTGSSSGGSSESSSGEPTGGAQDGALCADLGGYAGVKALVGGFVGKVVADEKINAYFLSTAVDGAQLSRCLEEQLGEAAGCVGVTYTCRDMKAAHTGLGISTNDFMDLAGDFSAALDEHMAGTPTLTDADKAAILELLGSMAPDIVEDPSNDATAYQRLGRRPAIHGLVNSDADSFIPRVAGDAAINGFFGAADIDRLTTCLVRQFTGATGGPAIYGKEVDAPAGVEPGVGAANPCKDMAASHAQLKDANDGLGIQYEDFVALVVDLQGAMDSKGVPADEQAGILAALGPLCADIVTVDPENCT